RSRSLNLEPLLSLFYDRPHSGGILREQSERGVYFLRGEKVDRSLSAFEFQFVQVEDGYEFERLDFGPFEAVVPLTFHDDDLVLPDGDPLNLVAEHHIDEDQNQPNGEEYHRPENATRRAVKSEENQH